LHTSNAATTKAERKADAKLWVPDSAGLRLFACIHVALQLTKGVAGCTSDRAGFRRIFTSVEKIASLGREMFAGQAPGQAGKNLGAAGKKGRRPSSVSSTPSRSARAGDEVLSSDESDADHAEQLLHADLHGTGTAEGVGSHTDEGRNAQGAGKPAGTPSSPGAVYANVVERGYGGLAKLGGTFVKLGGWGKSSGTGETDGGDGGDEEAAAGRSGYVPPPPVFSGAGTNFEGGEVVNFGHAGGAGSETSPARAISSDMQKIALAVQNLGVDREDLLLKVTRNGFSESSREAVDLEHLEPCAQQPFVCSRA